MTYFNSTMVRLKDFCPVSVVTLVEYFNSTMVRLKVLSGQCRYLGGIFQFHYGTIKSVIMCIYHALPLLFQFHYGTIKRNPAYRNRIANSISIPLWYD